jgi:amino acid adenylation domain-containing protein
VEYCTALFDRSTVERYLGYFQRLLKGMVKEPAQPVERVEILDRAERETLLHDWNRTEVHYPPQCVQEMFEAQVEKTPEATAVAFEQESLSYRELNLRANQLAHDLRRKGVRPDARVAICLERSPEMLVAIFGVLKAGGAYVPLDPAYPDERLAFMLRDSGAAVVLTAERLRAALSRIAPETGVVPLDIPELPWADAPETNPERAAIGLTPEHLAYVLYTSGSTGEPKGVMVTHRGLSNYLHWARDAYHAASSVVSSSFSFDGTVTSLYAPLLQGGTVRLVREHEEIDGLCAQLQTTEGAGLVKISPLHLDALGQRVASAAAPVAVDLFVIGGEALPPATVRLWREIRPNVRMVNEYGPTETVVGCVVYDIPRGADLGRSVPIGRPIANTRVYILDRHGEPVPVGVTGELHIAGAGVARGYLGRADLTRERFVPEPFVVGPDARMYRSGDLCRWREDGNIEFLGRNDFQVKIRGFRIELGEIEARLETHAAVREAVVVAREDTPGDKRLVAYYTISDDGKTEGDLAPALRAHLSAALPEYMVPAAFVRLDRLPLTASGKRDREALPPPAQDASAHGRYVEPVGETEAALAEIWAEVLQVERVGRHDNFFELGGHSLLAVRTITRVQEILSVEAAIADLFNFSVLSAFAARILDLQLAQFDAGQLDALKYYA